MRNDQLLVTTQGVRGGKKHHNIQGWTRISVSKGFNDATDSIEIDGYSGSGRSLQPRETALIQIDFKSGKSWSGTFSELEEALK